MADVAADVAAVLDALGLDTFVTAGWSGGGPHALACAALLPGRCLAAASIAGAAPFHAPGLDFTAGMGPENVEEFAAAVRGIAALTEFLDREAAASVPSPAFRWPRRWAASSRTRTGPCSPARTPTTSPRASAPR